MRAPAASSSRSATTMSPWTMPLMTALDARISPITRPLSERFSTASAPLALIAPSTRPSRCSPPVNSTSPRITVPSAINVVIAATATPFPLRLPLPNIIALLALDRIAPREILLDVAAVAVGLHMHAVRLESTRKHDGTVHLLKIFEAVLDPGRILPLRQRGPVERRELAVLDAFDRERDAAFRILAALEVLRQRRDEVPRLRIADAAHLQHVHGEPFALAAADQASIEREIGAERFDFLLAIAQRLLQIA